MFKTEINLGFFKNNDCILVDQYNYNKLLYFTPTYIWDIEYSKSSTTIGAWKIKELKNKV